MTVPAQEPNLVKCHECGHVAVEASTSDGVETKRCADCGHSHRRVLDTEWMYLQRTRRRAPFDFSH